jgi:hypothetical protein
MASSAPSRRGGLTTASTRRRAQTLSKSPPPRRGRRPTRAGLCRTEALRRQKEAKLDRQREARELAEQAGSTAPLDPRASLARCGPDAVPPAQAGDEGMEEEGEAGAGEEAEEGWYYIDMSDEAAASTHPFSRVRRAGEPPTASQGGS